MKHIRLIKLNSFLCYWNLTLIILSFIVAGCHNTENNSIKTQKYYFEYLGFSEENKLANLLEAVCKEQNENSYIITKTEVLTTWPDSIKVNKDTLHPLHQAIHKLIPITDNTKLKPNDVVITVEAKKQTNRKAMLFHYKKYKISETEERELQYDLGAHEIAGLKKDLNTKNVSFFAEKMAQVSFK